ncbi:E3 ubiquitin-protein ligase RNF186-like [Hippoglossus hippoglossus]|uniref:E3 ubiquitin-protein ligase RNF186-like n=1 Tax=Hippoglossus hippoglossus TaxID=8267 RepID=UPI00148C16AF|nr:E3 ubiquitin-protein ligase RNF186-like [Hippoglossus hippoglossus]
MAEEVSTEGDCGSAGTDSFPVEDYECKICYNYFDLDVHTPKVLGCSHTFCLECLVTLHSRDGRRWRIGCPVCRHRTPVPEYRVHNLPNNTAVTEALPLKELVTPDFHPAGASVSPAAASTEGEDSGHACKRVAFTTGCVCAIFSVLSTAVLLFLGLVFVHNFNSSVSPLGPVCLFVSSLLALFSLILTWLTCLLRYRPETGASNFSSHSSYVP